MPLPSYHVSLYAPGTEAHTESTPRLRLSTCPILPRGSLALGSRNIYAVCGKIPSAHRTNACSRSSEIESVRGGAAYRISSRHTSHRGDSPSRTPRASVFKHDGFSSNRATRSITNRSTNTIIRDNSEHALSMCRTSATTDVLRPTRSSSFRATPRVRPGTPCVDAGARQARENFAGALSRISILFDSIRVRARRTSRKPTFARTRIYRTVRPNGTDFIMPGLHPEAGQRRDGKSVRGGWLAGGGRQAVAFTRGSVDRFGMQNCCPGEFATPREYYRSTPTVIVARRRTTLINTTVKSISGAMIGARRDDEAC